MCRVIRFSSSDKTLFSKACQIRQKVFVEEQQVNAKDEFDEYEVESIHFLLIEKQFEIATARWRQTNKGIKLERFAVTKEFRGKGYGKKILKAVLDDVIPLNQPIYLHAQVSALEFYKKNRFEVKGDLFLECNIEHYLMQYKLNV